MDHPGIAQVFDGGATDDGRPYFVMELVQGVPINEYCDTHRLSSEERIRLFVDVCHAVQHAHHKGVVHRDLKPSNVLVTVRDDEAMVKIIDFGIAKALGHELTDRTLVTRIGQIVGTPEYMSPEQAERSGLDVDTRTDVYSLGVMLYELLVGALPFDFSARAEEAIRHAIRETEVPRPSTKLTSLVETRDTIARCRRTTVEALRRELRSDLDWIILKAMEKDRTRRYDTANGLALDLDRHLNDEPVLARAPSAGYRVAKFVRRHRLGVAAGTAIVTALVLGMALATIGMVRAQQAELRAEAEAEAAKQVSDFLVELFSVNDPSEALGNTITAREILDRGAERIEGEMIDQPSLQGRLMEVMGSVYTSLGLYRDAEPLLLRSLEVRRAALGSHHPDVATSLHALAWLYRAQSRLEEALPLAREAAEIRGDLLGPEDLETASSLQVLGMVQRDRGEFEAARENLERSLAIRETALGPDHIDVSTSLYHLGWLALREGEYGRAKELYQRSCAIAERELDPDSWSLGWCYNDLGVVTDHLGERDAAEEYFLRALRIFEKVLSPEHPSLGSLLNNLGAMYWRKGDYDAARLYYERALVIQESAFGPDNPRTAAALMNLALLSQSEGDYQSAYDNYQRALEIDEAALGPNSAEVGNVLGNLGYLLRFVGEYEDALQALERSLRIREEALGPDNPELVTTLTNLGFLYRDLRQTGKSVDFYRMAMDIIQESYPSPEVGIATQSYYIAGALNDAGRFQEALPLARESARVAEGTPDKDRELLWHLYWEEARAMMGLGEEAGADSLMDLAIGIVEEMDGPESGGYAEVQSQKWALKGDRARSMEWFRESIRRGNRSPWLLRNPELDLIRDFPDYRRLADEIRVTLRR
jgi:tetratricopeptide (TPR) repeat protein